MLFPELGFAKRGCATIFATDAGSTYIKIQAVSTLTNKVNGTMKLLLLEMVMLLKLDKRLCIIANKITMTISFKPV